MCAKQIAEVKKPNGDTDPNTFHRGSGPEDQHHDVKEGDRAPPNKAKRVRVSPKKAKAASQRGIVI